MLVPGPLRLAFNIALGLILNAYKIKSIFELSVKQLGCSKKTHLLVFNRNTVGQQPYEYIRIDRTSCIGIHRM